MNNLFIKSYKFLGVIVALISLTICLNAQSTVDNCGNEIDYHNILDTISFLGAPHMVFDPDINKKIIEKCFYSTFLHFLDFESAFYRIEKYLILNKKIHFFVLVKMPNNNFQGDCKKGRLERFLFSVNLVQKLIIDSLKVVDHCLDDSCVYGSIAYFDRYSNRILIRKSFDIFLRHPIYSNSCSMKDELYYLNETGLFVRLE